MFNLVQAYKKEGSGSVLTIDNDCNVDGDVFIQWQ